MLVDSDAEKGPKPNPHQRPDYVEADVQAIRAVMRGDATAFQQKRAMDFIINEVAGTYDMSYRPGDTHAAAFAEGKRFVGHSLVWFLKAAPTKTDDDKIAVRRLQNE